MIAYGYDMSVEIWKVIPDFPDYEASTYGRVRRCRVGGSNATKIGKVLKPGSTGGKMQYCNFVLYKDGEMKRVLAHRVVLSTFVGPPPSASHQGAHGNGSPRNNRLDNLRWATPRENSADQVLHGTVSSGTTHRNASLTERQVLAIRKLNARGIGITILAAAVGVGATTMGRVVRGVTYK